MRLLYKYILSRFRMSMVAGPVTELDELTRSEPSRQILVETTPNTSPSTGQYIWANFSSFYYAPIAFTITAFDILTINKKHL